MFVLSVRINSDLQTAAPELSRFWHLRNLEIATQHG